MNRLSPKTSGRPGFVSSRKGPARRANVAFNRSGSRIEVLEDRTLMSLDLNNVQNLKALPITTAQNASFTQDVATFNDTDSTAVAPDFTATINWGDSSSTAGIITEDASSLFHVSGTHTYAQPGSFPVTVTIKDVTNGTLYATNAFNQTNLVSSVAGNAGVTDPSLINPWGTSSSSASPIWVSDQGSGLATLYNPNGNPIKQGSPSRSLRPARRPGRQARSLTPTRPRQTSPSRARADRYHRSSFSPHSPARSPAGTQRPTAACHWP